VYVYDRYNEKERPLLYKNLPSIKRARQTVGPSIAHFLSRAFALLPPTLSSFYILYVRVSIRNVCRGGGGFISGKEDLIDWRGLISSAENPFANTQKVEIRRRAAAATAGNKSPPPLAPSHHHPSNTQVLVLLLLLHQFTNTLDGLMIYRR
jgi:hypothetical protein